MKIIKNKKAVVLILVLFILLLFSFLTLIATNLISKQTEPFIYHLNSIKALYLAEAGMNYFKEYNLLWDSSFTAGNFTRNLGKDNNQRFIIQVPTPVSARQATITVTGIADSGSAFEVRRKITISFNENTDRTKSPIPSFRVVNGYFGDPATPRIDPVPAGSVPAFKANVYFNSISAAQLQHYWSNIGFGGQPRNLYVEGNYCSTDACIGACGGYTPYVFGNCYAKGTIAECVACSAGAGNCIQGTSYCPNPPTAACTNIPAAVLNSWPQKPEIYENLPLKSADPNSYYNRMLAVAQTRTGGGYVFTGNTFLMNGANFYFNGNVTFNSMGGVGCRFSGPGNIVVSNSGSNALIYIEGETNPTVRTLIGERISLIADRIEIRNEARIGGVNVNAQNLITDLGSRLYARGDGNQANYDIDVSAGTANPPLIKGVLMTPAGASNNNSIRLGLNAANPHAQIQGVVYTRRIYFDIATIFGYLYADLITNIPTFAQASGSFLSKGTINDRIDYGAGPIDVLNEVPLEVKGLELTIQSQPTYGP